MVSKKLAYDTIVIGSGIGGVWGEFSVLEVYFFSHFTGLTSS